MNREVKDKFIKLWRKYFNNTEFPITFYYSDGPKQAEIVKPGSVNRCVIGALLKVMEGQSLAFNVSSVGCFGGRKYLGFTESFRPEFEYFLSCGISGKMDGERYKKSSELVKQIVTAWPSLKAPAEFIIFKKWDKLEVEDEPEVVIFYAQPDVISGLYTLAKYDEPEPQAVITPMGSGCSSVVTYPYLEKESPHTKPIIGMFDPSARPYIPKMMLSFSVPMKIFVTMIENMEESFLITDIWKELQKRIE